MINSTLTTPVDVLLSYSHLTLQNSTFNAFAPHFYGRAQVKELLAASPLSMGLLTPKPPPWHPGLNALKPTVEEALKLDSNLPNLALGFTARHTGTKMPLVGGFSNVREVHECVRVWREVQEKKGTESRLQREEDVIALFEKSQFFDWSWNSP